jgi:hypothetical protein
MTITRIVLASAALCMAGPFAAAFLSTPPPGGGWGAAQAQERRADGWLTKAELTGFRETGDYEETHAYARRLDEASPWIRLVSFGTSPQGRDLMLLVVSKDGAFDPAAARAAGKPVVLVQNAIHPGEIEGKDASLMLLRDIAVTKEREELLDNVTLLVMPLFNVDGYGRFGPHTRINQNGPRESGWRTTAQNLNLNRDYMKADAPEMKAWLGVYTAWWPDLLIDDHTTDGADFQYVITYQMGTQVDVSPSIAAWGRDVFLPYLYEHVERAGFPVGPYPELRDPLDPGKGFDSFSPSGRYSTGYTPLQNRPSLLVETHMLKPYEPRVRSTYETLVAALEVVGRDPEALQRTVRQAEAAASEIGLTAEGDSIPLTFELSDSAGTLDYRGVEYRHELSEVSGAVRVIYGEKPLELEVPFASALAPALKVRPPLGYLIPAQWREIAERLRLHGVPVERLERPVSGTFEVVRFSEVSWAKEPFEGRHMVTYKTGRGLETDSLPPGSFWVPLNNARARVAMQLLEPEGPDSFVAWGFLNAIFESKEYAEDYVMERVAREMLEADPKLEDEFESKVAADSTFRADPAARLEFFYRRSPYWDSRKDRYPILRVVTPLE